MRRKLTTLLFWAVMLYANAQFISFQLPIDNVMNSYQIRCVTQDKRGFIWMGTGSGLYRYDGYQYKKIQTHQQPDLLPNEAVLTISRWGMDAICASARINNMMEVGLGFVEALPEQDATRGNLLMLWLILLVTRSAAFSMRARYKSSQRATKPAGSIWS